MDTAIVMLLGMNYFNPSPVLAATKILIKMELSSCMWQKFIQWHRTIKEIIE